MGAKEAQVPKDRIAYLNAARARLEIGLAPIQSASTVPPAHDDAVLARSIAQKIEHTLLRPNATPQDVETLCHEAVEHGFLGVCVNAMHVPLVLSVIGNAPVRCVAAIGFPLGASTTAAKAFEAAQAVGEGAHEIDFVLPIGMLKAGRHGYVAHDLGEIVRAAGPNTVTKVIIEACLLTDAEKRLACNLVREIGAGFVKTSTGFAAGGATIDDVRLLKECAGNALGIKAAGGIRSYDSACALLAAGATRIGTSASVAIVNEEGRQTALPRVRLV